MRRDVAVLISAQEIACVAGVKGGKGRGKLGARERAQATHERKRISSRGIPTKFHALRLRPKIVQPLTLLYIILTEKVPLSSYTFYFLTAVNALCPFYDKLTKQELFLDMFS